VPFFTTKILCPLAGAIALSSVSQAAWAADCRPFLAAPTDAEIAANIFSISMVTLSPNGKATYAFGKAVYQPPQRRHLGQTVFFTPAVWRTPEGTGATYLTDLNKTLLRVPQSQAEALPGFVGVDLQLIVGTNAGVRIKYLSPPGVHHELNGTCSTGGVIHATTPVVDFLIVLTRPPKV
jgi:hypothetical protein